MRVYIIGSDGITLCRKMPTAVNDGEIAVASNEELHVAPISAKRLLALWNALPGVEKRKKVGDRDALIDQLWLAIEALSDPEPQPDPKPHSKQDVVIAMLRLPEGATVDEVASVTGWQRHTVRGVFSGTLKKKLGLTLASAKEEREQIQCFDCFFGKADDSAWWKHENPRLAPQPDANAAKFYEGSRHRIYAGLIARSFSAVSPRIATRSASLSPGVARMWSTAVLVQGNGKSVPKTIWLAPTSAIRWRNPSGVKTIES
jgi:hypothetical protein